MLQGIAAAVHDTAAGYIPEHAPTSTRRELQAVVDSAWQMYWAADYSEAGALLPPLLYAAHRAAHEAADGESGPALSALSDGYQVAAYVANQLGRRDLAYTAATEASAAARRAGDPIRTARVEGCRSWIYRKDGRVKDSLAIAERAAASIEPSYSAASTAQLTAYGNLVMHCAVASSRLEREQPARDYLSQAHAVGARLGREYHAHGGQFGPANAAAKAVDVLLAVKQVGQALDLISTFHGQADLAPAVRHRYQLDVALAQCEARQWDTCLDTLLAVCTEAPDWARHQTLPAVIVSRLQGGSQSRLRKVSAILGSTPA
ncbi:XRE family transcriptional regulator [Streptomyces sp. PA03-6a]|nr:XRE family transcriptional regulator [Streptomyces sp. PA03-6a]